MTYLTEKLLADFVLSRFSGKIVFDKPFLKYRFRPDIFIESENLVIEFDGFRHYQQAAIILADQNKDEILHSHGIKVIRLPYFVQLDELVVKNIFSDYRINHDEFNLYSHGFHDKKALLPADFCELGILKFKNDLEKFSFIAKDIINSMEQKVINFDNNELKVYPPSLLYIRGKIRWKYLLNAIKTSKYFDDLLDDCIFSRRRKFYIFEIDEHGMSKFQEEDENGISELSIFLDQLIGYSNRKCFFRL